MTENKNQAGDEPLVHEERAVGSSPSGVIVAGGVVGLLLAGALVFAGFTAFSGVNASSAAAETPATTKSATKAPPKPTPDTDGTTSGAGSGDPTPPPDRDSDQKQSVLPSEQLYTIQPGDTLTSISSSFGIGIDSLAEYNSIRDSNVLSEWATLVIPPLDWLPVPPMAE